MRASSASTPTRAVFPVRDYDLAATLASGQAFRWRQRGAEWEGVIGARWVRLQSGPDRITAETAMPVANWDWLAEYLQVEVDLEAVLTTFPADEPMRAAVAACRGLRLLRQAPWECLASFILSSTKQIVQIQQIIALLCRRYGSGVVVPPGYEPVHAFPPPERLARCSEAELGACKMGFRARYLRATAQKLAAGEVEVAGLGDLPVDDARAELMKLPGVGPKIADCVLLFAYGFPQAFPVDVWVMKALCQLYFPRRRVTLRRLRDFASTHFGPCAGYAQQYLFHYMRTKKVTPGVKVGQRPAPGPALPAAL
jgi:N-glycosylase/DNA lyase